MSRLSIIVLAAAALPLLAANPARRSTPRSSIPMLSPELEHRRDQLLHQLAPRNAAAVVAHPILGTLVRSARVLIWNAARPGAALREAMSASGEGTLLRSPAWNAHRAGGDRPPTFPRPWRHGNPA